MISSRGNDRLRQKAGKAEPTDPATFRKLLEAAPEAMVLLGPAGTIVFANKQVESMFGYGQRDLLGRRIEKLIPVRIQELPRNGRGSMNSFLVKGSVRRSLMKAERADGIEFPAEVRLSSIRTKNGFFTLSCIRDISDRLAAELALQQAKEDAQARATELEAILDTAPGMTLIARDPACSLMTGGRVAYELLRQPYGCNLSKTAPKDQGPSGFRVVRNGQEVSGDRLPVQRAAATGRVQRDSELTIVYANGDKKDFLGNAAPLLSPDGTVCGAVGVFVDITARKVAERATRMLYNRMLSIENKERRRIARELHDSVGQNLTALVLSLGALKGTPARHDKIFRRALSDALAAAREAAAEVRTLSHLLHPPLLHEFGLAEAIRTYVRGFSDRSSIQVGLRLPSKPLRFSEDLETSLFRVVQEGLTNVYRHSGSKYASINLHKSNENIVLEIQDFGPAKRSVCPRRPKASKPQGVGLTGIGERLDQFGGRLEVQSGSKGTLLRAVLPFGKNTGS